MEEEIWLPVEGYEGYYEISNLGNVRSLNLLVNCKAGSLRKRYGRLLKTKENGMGYAVVSLAKYGLSKKVSVHRLVAHTFIPNPENKPFVNHIDNKTMNNKVSNLEWCTPKENIQHAVKQGRFTGINVKYFTDSEIKQIRELYKQGVSQKELTIRFGSNKYRIHAIVKNKTRTRYKEK